MSLQAPRREAFTVGRTASCSRAGSSRATSNSNFVIDEGSIITDEMIRGINKPVAVSRRAQVYSEPANAALGQQRCLISVIASESVLTSGIRWPRHTGNALEPRAGRASQWRGKRGCARDRSTQKTTTQKRRNGEPSRETLAALACAIML
jgi:hypothetical protein